MREHGGHPRPDREVARHECRAHGGEDVGRRCALGGEGVPEFARQELRRDVSGRTAPVGLVASVVGNDAAAEHHVDRLGSVRRPGCGVRVGVDALAEVVLRTAVVPLGSPPVGADVVVPLVGVPGPGSGRCLDIGLGVVADTEEEQLHQLAGEVLVRRRRTVLVVVEVPDHRHLRRHRPRERAHVVSPSRRHRSICSRIRTAEPTLPRSLQKCPCQKNAMRSWNGRGRRSPCGRARSA